MNTNDDDIVWVWDRGSPDRFGEYHAYHYRKFAEGRQRSLCGQFFSDTPETKTPGAPKCESCKEAAGVRE